MLPLKGTVDRITVEIAPVDAGDRPIVGSPLASTSVAFAKPPAYTSVDVSLPTRPNLAAGKRYAIVLSSPSESASSYVAWQGDIGSTYGDQSGGRCANGGYPGGRAWSIGTAPLGADADLFFETYVAPASTPPATATISVVTVRSLPASPVAGAAFTVLPSITLSTGRNVTPTNVRCAARLGSSLLKGRGRGGCTVRIPTGAGGERLAVTVTAGYGGKTKTRAVSYTVRRPSRPPPPPSPPPAPPSPIARPGHYAGTTSILGTPVGFDVTSDGRTVTNITFSFSIPCSTGTLSNPGISVLQTTRFTIAADGSFAPFTNATTTLSGSVTGRLTFTFGGRFTGPGSARGTLVVKASVTAPVFDECGPFADSWTATRG